MARRKGTSSTAVRTSAVSLVPIERIERAILLLRGHRVMLDADLANLYGVETGALTRAVRRNANRFPADFMFQLTKQEFEDLRRQSGISSVWGGRRYAPYAFTEQGVAMLSSVLRSERAVLVNIEIMRAFVQLRQMLSSHVELARKLAGLEKKYNAQFKIVFRCDPPVDEPSRFRKQEPDRFRSAERSPLAIEAEPREQGPVSAQ
jgi:hypothetical protein